MKITLRQRWYLWTLWSSPNFPSNSLFISSHLHQFFKLNTPTLHFSPSFHLSQHAVQYTILPSHFHHIFQTKHLNSNFPLFILTTFHQLNSLESSRVVQGRRLRVHKHLLESTGSVVGGAVHELSGEKGGIWREDFGSRAHALEPGRVKKLGGDSIARLMLESCRILWRL
jgi:hypothetical protein